MLQGPTVGGRPRRPGTDVRLDVLARADEAEVGGRRAVGALFLHPGEEQQAEEDRAQHVHLQVLFPVVRPVAELASRVVDLDRIER